MLATTRFLAWLEAWWCFGSLARGSRQAPDGGQCCLLGAGWTQSRPRSRLGMSIMGGLPRGLCLRPPAPAPSGSEPIRRGPVGKAPPRAFGAWLTPAPRGTIGQWSRAGMGHPLCLPSLHPRLQAAPGARALCIPRIILTECAPNPPSPPEARLEEPGPRTTPTPRPRTLVGSGRAPPEVVAEASRPSSSWMPEKAGPPLKRQGSGGYSQEEGGARVPCSRGPAPDRTQEPSTAETREDHPEETPKDSGPGSGQCEGQPGAGLGGTVRGATPQRMDSLEETLRELEATLSQMGTAPSERPLGSLPPLPPRPKVAASSPVLPSCLNAPVSPSSELEGVGGCRSTQTAPVSHWPSLSSCHPPGSLAPGRVCRLSPRRLGSWPPQGPAHPGLAGTRASPLLCICKPTNKVFSLFPPPPPLPSCVTLSVSVVLCLRLWTPRALPGRSGTSSGSRGWTGPS
ncbi:PREDICTED: basic proline-rich protein-like [Myotis brandtii]|uniref:basic proline-rich protein-like n=1 Tax=Myotis brandtii TaxID=109478 RepID=UPI0003BB857C|nr:PREDICTED: basic proline-rich protein-like [Myotis brandtii]